ncbi:hypothetical protein [Nonomuraea sp. NPDC048901]
MPYLSPSDGGVVNTVSGTVDDSVVQACDVHGGIGFGVPGRTEP